MQFEKNSRQVPKIKEVLSEKYYSDILYCHLQVISERNEDKVSRDVSKKDINFSKLAEELGMTRQTISKKFKKLIELGLLVEEGDKYNLVVLETNQVFFVPQETLRKMVSCFNERTISIYVYLANRYYANQDKGFDFNITGLKELTGLGTKTNNNNYIITDILEFLQKLGLIKYGKKTGHDEHGQIKTVYSLESLTLTC